jgi:iron complex outermembrane recepter protein
MNTNNQKQLGFLTYIIAAGLTGVGAAPGAQAQTQAPSATAAAGDDSVLQEVVVTAFKQGAQSVQAVSSSIDVLSADRLEAMGVTNFADFSRSVPGLNFVDSGPGDKRYIIRGINSAGEAQTALYIDNVPLTGLGGAATDFGGTQADLDLYDVHQIEVLRGPQGTLYGANSQAGVIRFVTNQADPSKFEASTLIDLSDTQSGGFNYQAKGMVNLPLIDGKLAVRLVGYDDYASGFIDNPLRDQNNYNNARQDGGRASIKWQIDADTSLGAQAFYQHLDSDGHPLERPFNTTRRHDLVPNTGYPDAATQIDERDFKDTTKDFALFGEATWS